MTTAAVVEGFDPTRRLSLTRRVLLTGEIIGAYLGARRELGRAGLPATLESARSARRPQAPPADQTPRADAERRYAAYRLGRAVERILRFLPDARCLVRSVVLVRLLADRGIDSTLVIGVAPAPDFRAHAWVEFDGLALLPAHEWEYSRLVEL